MSEATEIKALVNTAIDKLNSISGKVSSVDEITLATRLPGADNATVADVLVAAWKGVRGIRETILGTRLPGANNARLDEVVVGMWLAVRALRADVDELKKAQQ